MDNKPFNEEVIEGLFDVEIIDRVGSRNLFSKTTLKLALAGLILGSWANLGQAAAQPKNGADSLYQKGKVSFDGANSAIASDQGVPALNTSESGSEGISLDNFNLNPKKSHSKVKKLAVVGVAAGGAYGFWRWGKDLITGVDVTASGKGGHGGKAILELGNVKGTLKSMLPLASQVLGALSLVLLGIELYKLSKTWRGSRPKDKILGALKIGLLGALAVGGLLNPLGWGLMGVIGFAALGAASTIKNIAAKQGSY